MRTLILLFLISTPCFAQAVNETVQEANTINNVIKVDCFKNRIEAEVLAQSYKGYEVFKNDTNGNIDYCVLPPTHGDTVVWLTEE